MVAFSKLAATGIALASTAAAHPGEKYDMNHVKRSIQVRDNIASVGARALGQCSGGAAARRLKSRNIARRAEVVKSLREKRGITTKSQKFRRDLAALEAWEEVNHNMTGVSTYDMFTSLETVFDANTSCVLAPEVTAGPYYITGEYLRSNVKEAEWSDGVDVFLEVQYVDINTCGPVPAVAVDVWNCNATGIYSGISTSGNYAVDGVNSTYLRGIQLTDHEGVVSFETIFPGHYDGRAVHTHLLAHTNATVQANGTIDVWNKAVAHIGQLFWPEELRAEIEVLEPYSQNTQTLTTNDEDMWSIVQTSADYDPFPQFVYLGEDVSDGLFAWIQIGINASADYQNDEYYGVAGYIDEDGGHAQDSGIGGGSGGGGPSGNGTAPTGAPPS